MTPEGECLPLREVKGGVSFAVRVQPRAARNEVSGVQQGALKVRLTSPPVEGAANRACIDFLADLLHVSRSRISIASGERSRNKLVTVEGASIAEIDTFLSPLLQQRS